MNRWSKLKSFLIICIAIVILAGCSDIKNDTTTQNGYQLSEWLGNYEFYEYFPPNINMEYNINIYQENEECFANISIDGFQTTQRIQADVKGNTEGIDMIFETYLSESTGENIEKGKILISFKKEDSEIYTYWGEIQPILPENMKQGIYFVKTEE